MPKHKLCILVYSPFKNLRRRKKAGSGCLKIIIINSSSAWPLHTQVLSLPLLLHFSWEKRAIYYFWFMYGKLPSTLPPFSSAYEWSLRTRMSFFFFLADPSTSGCKERVLWWSQTNSSSLSLNRNFLTEILPTGSKFYLLPAQ